LVLVDVEHGTKEQTLQRAIHGVSREKIRSAVEELAVEAAAPFAPSAPWYQEWWLWTLVGAAAIAGTTSAVLLTRGGGEEPDLTIRFPKQP
jgi:hypothetical protein